MTRRGQIQARLAAATPGEWKVNFHEGVIQVGPAGKGDLAWITNLKDAELIAQAPSDLVYLLRLVEAGEQVIKAYDCEIVWKTHVGCQGSKQATRCDMCQAFSTYAAVQSEK